jgi:uncharacterized protein
MTATRHRRLKWISNITKMLEFEAIHSKSQKDHCAGKWLFSHDDFKSWKQNGKSRGLWVSGKMGCGKSVVASNVIQQIRNKTREGASMAIAAVYCSSDLPMTYQGVLGAILHQLFGYLPYEQDIRLITDAWGKNEMQINTIEQAILDLIPRFVRTFIIVDGLDEFHRRNADEFPSLCSFLGSLTHDAHSTLSPLRLLVFSRPGYSDITSAMENSTRLDINASMNKDEIEKFVDTELEKLDLDCEAKTTMLQSLTEHADGSFIWAYHVIKHSSKARSQKEMMTAIQKMPKELMGIYAAILHEIISQRNETYDDETDDGEMEEDWSTYDTTVDALIWVARASQPLTRAELGEALSVRPRMTTIDDSVRTRANILDKLCEQSGGLLEFSNGCYRLAHDSVREFLEKPPTRVQYGVKASRPDYWSEVCRSVKAYSEWNQKAEARLAKICLTYLCLEVFKDGPARSSAQLSQLQSKYPLLKYAANHWGYHLGKADKNGSGSGADDLEQLLHAYLSSQSSRDLGMQIIRADNHTLFKPYYPKPFPYQDSTSLHQIAWFGLQHLLRGPYFRQSQDVFDKRDSYGFLPLDYAVVGNQRAVFNWMLDHFEADPAGANSGFGLPFNSECLPLHNSATEDWSDSIKKLLALGFDKNMRLEKGDTPLHCASRAGAMGAIHVLLEAGAELDPQNSDGETPLIVATLCRQKAACRVLLDKNADVNIRRNDGATVIHCLAEYDSDLVRILLEKGATFQEMDHNGTPLHSAVVNDQLETIRILCEHLRNKGGSVLQDELSRQNSGGRTALTLASSNAARILVDEFGDDPLQKLLDGSTLLGCAARLGDPNIISFLIDKGVDPNAADNNMRTPLHVASAGGHVSFVKHLLESSPTLDELLQDKWGQVALHEAASHGNFEVVQLLSRAGSDVADVDGDLPLHLAVLSGDIRCFEALSTKTTSLTADQLHRALRLAVQQGSREITCRLLDRGANMNAAEANGTTVLHVAAHLGHEEVAQLLISRGCELLCRDSNGRIPLMLSIAGRHASVAKIILGNQHEMLDVRDNYGQTCAHMAAESGSLEMWDLVWQSDPGRCKSTISLEQNHVFVAASMSHASMVDRLISDVLATDDQDIAGFTVLMRAVMDGHAGIVSRLVCERGSINISQPDKIGRTPLHWACRRRLPGITKILLDAGFDDRKKDLLGLTPADYAIDDRGVFSAMQSRQKDNEEKGFNPTSRARDLCDFIRDTSIGLSNEAELRKTALTWLWQWHGKIDAVADALIKMRRFEDASYLLSEQATSPHISITCGICQASSSGGFMKCKHCYEVELCFSCYEHYSATQTCPSYRRTLESLEFEARLIAEALEPIRHFDARALSEVLDFDNLFVQFIRGRVVLIKAALSECQGDNSDRADFPGSRFLLLLGKVIRLASGTEQCEEHDDSPQTAEELTKDLRGIQFEEITRERPAFSCREHQYIKVATVDELDEEKKAHFTDGLLRQSFFADLANKYTIHDEDLGQLLPMTEVRDALSVTEEGVDHPPAESHAAREDNHDTQFDIYDEIIQADTWMNLLGNIENPYQRGDGYKCLDRTGDADVAQLEEVAWRLAKAVLTAISSPKELEKWFRSKGIWVVAKTRQNSTTSEELDQVDSSPLLAEHAHIRIECADDGCGGDTNHRREEDRET